MSLPQEYSVHEIFTSMDGEVNAFGQGKPTVFLRLNTCNLRCVGCDTLKAQVMGSEESLFTTDEILEDKNFNPTNYVKKVTITGGEPLLWDLNPLVSTLLNFGYKVSIETNGTIVPQYVWNGHRNVSFVFDYKTPSSGADREVVHKNLSEILHMLWAYPNTYLKCVIKDEDDFKDVQNNIVSRIRFNQLGHEIYNRIALSPWFDANNKIGAGMTAQKLLNLMVKAPKLSNCLVNIQIHKYIHVA